MGLSKAAVSINAAKGMPITSVEAAQAWRDEHIDPARRKGQRFDKYYKPIKNRDTETDLPQYRINTKNGKLQQRVHVSCQPSVWLWLPVLRLVWESANGAIPKHHRIIFKPGQDTNVIDEITPSRLECVSPAEWMTRCRPTYLRSATGKNCSKCAVFLPFSLFYKNKSARDGLTSECKVCAAAREHKKRQEKAKTRQPHRTNKTEVLGGVLGKICFTCKTFKTTTEFFKESKNYSGLSGACKSCGFEPRRAAVKKYYEAHHVEALQRRADYVRKNYESVSIKRRATKKADAETLHPRYVEKLLKLPKSQITPHLVDLKTQALQIRRIRKDISTTLKKGNS